MGSLVHGMAVAHLLRFASLIQVRVEENPSEVTVSGADAVLAAL